MAMQTGQIIVMSFHLFLLSSKGVCKVNILCRSESEYANEIRPVSSRRGHGVVIPSPPCRLPCHPHPEPIHPDQPTPSTPTNPPHPPTHPIHLPTPPTTWNGRTLLSLIPLMSQLDEAWPLAYCNIHDVSVVYCKCSASVNPEGPAHKHNLWLGEMSSLNCRSDCGYLSSW